MELQQLEPRSKWPLFWCLKPEDQAKLMQYQWDNYGGDKLEIPAPMRTSEAAWQSVMLENSDEIDRLMRQAPNPKRKVNL